ncbi:MAG TPA: antibiotic biosynthesis monooxygenase family protein [Candidatus Acidoferrum sp.]|nr:antibiotic biosynthesis monooxygenase family protein [Candidatus Acidoferrum sp.]
MDSASLDCRRANLENRIAIRWTLTMIARVWASRVTKSNLKAYLKHFSRNVLPDLRRYDGFASALVLTRDLDNETEVVVNTFWKNLAAIKAFAGSDCEAAVVVPEAAALLTSYDKRVKHYVVDVADSSESISLFAGRD